MSDDIYFMQQALHQAKLAAERNEVPVGAVIVHKGEIIARAHNQPIMNHDCSAHAEILALRRAGEVLQNYRLIDTQCYATLEPCVMCAGALIQARVAEIIYATHDTQRGAAGSVFQLLQSPHLNHQVVIRSGVLATESRALLQNFFRARR